MNIKIIEPIGKSEAAIRSRLKDIFEKGGHNLFICDTRGLTDVELIQNVSDAYVVLLRNRPLSRAVIEGVELDDLLGGSFMLSLSVPLTADTRGFIGREQLAKMKTSAILINTARGPVIDQSALVEALELKRLAGAGLDVFDIEPPLASDHPILKEPNTLLVPHIGF